MGGAAGWGSFRLASALVEGLRAGAFDVVISDVGHHAAGSFAGLPRRPAGAGLALVCCLYGSTTSAQQSLTEPHADEAAREGEADGAGAAVVAGQKGADGAERADQQSLD